jgi:hypothetical protein
LGFVSDFEFRISDLGPVVEFSLQAAPGPSRLKPELRTSCPAIEIWCMKNRPQDFGYGTGSHQLKEIGTLDASRRAKKGLVSGCASGLEFSLQAARESRKHSSGLCAG